jgi:hypothetical protein
VSGGLLYTRDRLIVPQVSNVHELLFHLTHNVLEHFGFAKTYGLLQGSFYWPNMPWDLEQGYVPGCSDCQQNKGSTQKPLGPLHPLPIPNQWGNSVAMDFVGPLPKDSSLDCIVKFMD